MNFLKRLVVIGGWGNTRQAIRKTTDDDIFEQVQLRNLISEAKQTRVLVQMTPGTVRPAHIQCDTQFILTRHFSCVFPVQMD